MPTRRDPSNQARTTGASAAVLGAAAVPLLLAGGYLWLLGGTSPLDGTRPGGPWTLTRNDGAVVSDRDCRGRFLLICFGYAACPDVCPTTLSAVSGGMRQLGARAERLQPLFITPSIPDATGRRCGGATSTASAPGSSA